MQNIRLGIFIGISAALLLFGLPAAIWYHYQLPGWNVPIQLADRWLSSEKSIVRIPRRSSSLRKQ